MNSGCLPAFSRFHEKSVVCKAIRKQHSWKQNTRWVETNILCDSKKNLSQTTGLSKKKIIIRKQKQIEHVFF